jgi:hypothetical protein
MRRLNRLTVAGDSPESDVIFKLRRETNHEEDFPGLNRDMLYFLRTARPPRRNLN